MHAHLFVPPLTDAQRQSLQHGLRSAAAFTVRRCQIVLASADRASPSAMPVQLGCTAATVRNTSTPSPARTRLLAEKSSQPHLGPSLHRRASRRSPQGLVAPKPAFVRQAHQPVDPGSTGRAATAVVGRLGYSAVRPSAWPQTPGHPLAYRMKHWITSPDPACALARPTDPPGRDTPGLGAETSRTSAGGRIRGPTAPARAGRGRTAALGRARRRPHRPRPQGGTACYGLLRADTGGMLLRFVQGRP